MSENKNSEDKKFQSPIYKYMDKLIKYNYSRTKNQ